jgi:hypothetical protein
MKSLAEDGSIEQPWFGPESARSEFPVSSAHESIKAARISIRAHQFQGLQDRWVTNLNEDRKRFYLRAALLDSHIKVFKVRSRYSGIRMYQSLNLVL